MKRLLSLMLIIAMLLSAAYTLVSCGEEQTPSAPSGNTSKPEPKPEPESDGVIYTLSEDGSYASVTGADGEKAELTIASEYMGVPVAEIADGAFKGNSLIVSVIIPDTVEAIGTEAFANCSKLVSIMIPDGVVKIAKDAFSGSNKIAYTEYEGAYYLGNTDNPHAILVKCTSTYNSSVIIHSNTKLIVSNAFEGCYNIAYMIEDGACYIGTADNPYYFLVGYSSNAFEFTPHVNTKVIGPMAFSTSYNLHKVNLPEGLLVICDTAFKNAYNLNFADIPDSVRYIGDEAFYECTALQRFAVGASVEYIGERATYNTPYLKEITVAEGNTHFKVDSGALYCTDTSEIIMYPTASTETEFTVLDGTKSIGEAVFLSSKLQKITLPESLVRIGVRAFCACGSLTDINIPASCKVIDGYAFYNCRALLKITIPEGVEEIREEAFSACSKLATISIPNSLRYLGDRAFFISGKNGPVCSTPDADGACYIGNEENPHLILLQFRGTASEYKVNENTKFISSLAFNSVTTLEKIVIPEGLIGICDAAFVACSSLATVDLGENSEIKYINTAALQYCSALTSFVFPAGVEVISGGMFVGCSSLSSVTLPANAKIIEKNAFQNADALVELIIPEGVTEIGEMTFYNCELLEKVVVPTTIEFIGENAFYYSFNLTVYFRGSDNSTSDWGEDWDGGRPIVWNYTESAE